MHFIASTNIMYRGNVYLGMNSLLNNQIQPKSPLYIYTLYGYIAER